MNDEQVAQLLQLYFNGSITPDQRETLATWIQEHGHSETFETLMHQSWQQFQPEQAVAGDKAGEWWQHIMAHAGGTPVVSMTTRPRRLWLRWTAAAVLLLAVAGFWLLAGRRNADKPPVAETPVIHDVPPPAVSKAVLTLANGQQILLDSAADGSLAVQGAVSVVKLKDGELSYNSRESGVGSQEPIQYNTLTVPAGSRITGITLSDGTKVLLNAASSITYPVAFAGNERRVSMTGEVYFEVASLPLTLPTGQEGTKGNPPASHGKMPFIVSVNGKQEVEVLGTHFNINAYDDEESIKTTLLEGKVKVSVTGSRLQTPDSRLPTADSRLLIPGEQAQLTTNNKLQTTNRIDIDQVMSWQKGMFLYKGTDIKTIMREVARTYNVNVHYESVSNEKFYAEVSRNTNISSLLKMLELTGEVHFNVQGNQVTVLK